VSVRTKIEPIDSWVQVVVRDDLSPEARSKAVADLARTAIADAREGNRRVLGRDTPAKTFVDGREGAPLESVDPDRGVIVAEFDLAMDVLNWIANRLREASPVRSGAYRDAHRLFADGREVLPTEDIPQAAEFSFTNTVPYARRLEVGRTKSGRAFVIQVEPRIYERVAKEARQRFGNIAQVGYTFRALAGVATAGRGRGEKKKDLRYPTITVALR